MKMLHRPIDLIFSSVHIFVIFIFDIELCIISFHVGDKEILHIKLKIEEDIDILNK